MAFPATSRGAATGSFSSIRRAMTSMLHNVERLTDLTWTIRAEPRARRHHRQRWRSDRSRRAVRPAEAGDADSRNFVLCPGKAYDRSPCGTGTSAKLACLYADGKLAPGEIWRQESIVGSVFEGHVDLVGERLSPPSRARVHQRRSDVDPRRERSVLLGDSVVEYDMRHTRLYFRYENRDLVFPMSFSRKPKSSSARLVRRAARCTAWPSRTTSLAMTSSAYAKPWIPRCETSKLPRATSQPRRRGKCSKDPSGSLARRCSLGGDPGARRFRIWLSKAGCRGSRGSIQSECDRHRSMRSSDQQSPVDRCSR